MLDFSLINRSFHKETQPWSSGYWRKLMFQRSWAWIPAHWMDIFHILICCKICNGFEKTKINEKEARVGPFFKKKKETQLLYSKIKHSDRMLQVMWLVLTNHSEIFHKRLLRYFWGLLLWNSRCKGKQFREWSLHLSASFNMNWT